MELRHLRYFVAVAEELHFGRAAARLHIAQPPLSQQIRQLESELGVPLLIRSTRRVELTAAGRAFLARGVEILNAVTDAAGQARRIADGVEGRLTIGCVGSATYSLLPTLVRALRTEMPKVDLSVRGEMLAPAQLAALHTGDIDIALLRPPVVDPDIITDVIRRDQVLVALPSDHILCEKETVQITDLRGEDFISHAGRGRSRMATYLTSICADAGFAPRIRQEVEETSTLVTLVAGGLGVALVPQPTAELALPGVSYRHLSPGSNAIELIGAYLHSRTSPVITNVIAILRRITDD